MVPNWPVVWGRLHSSESGAPRAPTSTMTRSVASGQRHVKRFPELSLATGARRRLRGPKLDRMRAHNWSGMKRKERSDDYGRTHERRIAGAHCRAGETSGREKERFAGIPGRRKRRRQRVWTGTVSGDTVLRTMDPAAGRGGWTAGVSGREQEPVEDERQRRALTSLAGLSAGRPASASLQ